MGRILVLAEKPAMGRDIARILGCGSKGKGHLVGDDYVVTWAIGHLVTLCNAEDYDKAFKRWKLELLPIIPKQMQIKLDEKQDIQQFYMIKALMNDPGIDSVICATDAGREGELIFRYIYAMAGCTKPFQRLWVSSLTDEALRQGFMNLKPGSQYDNLYYSALSRSYADWLVGINTTRLYTVKYGARLTTGRVQTPTLALMVVRQKEIDDFKSKDYWEVQALYDRGFSGQWVNRETQESRLQNKEQADSIAAKVKGKSGTVKNIDEDLVKDPPPLLYDLTELQRDANRKYGYTAKDTLDIAQRLYERRKYITYPRTDSRYLSEDIVSTLKSRLRALKVEPYIKTAGYLMNLSQLPVTKRIVDNKEVTDHHAIIPTPMRPNIESLSEEEERIYDLIVRRFLCVFYPRYEYTIKTIIVECEGEDFISRGKTINDPGWMLCYREYLKENEDEEERKKTGIKDQELPDIKKGDRLTLVNAKVQFHKTNPPAPYTEATLLSAMENVGRFVDSAELKQHLKEAKGLGTPATRAATIEKLIEIGYVKRRNEKYLIPTEKGKKLIEVVHEELKSPEMTGQWEKSLEHVANGDKNMTKEIFMSCIVDFIRDTIEEVKYSEKRDVIFEDEQPEYRRWKKC